MASFEAREAAMEYLEEKAALDSMVPACVSRTIKAFCTCTRFEEPEFIEDQMPVETMPEVQVQDTPNVPLTNATPLPTPGSTLNTTAVPRNVVFTPLLAARRAPSPQRVAPRRAPAVIRRVVVLSPVRRDPSPTRRVVRCVRSGTAPRPDLSMSMSMMSSSRASPPMVRHTLTRVGGAAAAAAVSVVRRLSGSRSRSSLMGTSFMLDTSAVSDKPASSGGQPQPVLAPSTKVLRAPPRVVYLRAQTVPPRRRSPSPVHAVKAATGVPTQAAGPSPPPAGDAVPASVENSIDLSCISVYSTGVAAAQAARRAHSEEPQGERMEGLAPTLLEAMRSSGRGASPTSKTRKLVKEAEQAALWRRVQVCADPQKIKSTPGTSGGHSTLLGSRRSMGMSFDADLSVCEDGKVLQRAAPASSSQAAPSVLRFFVPGALPPRCLAPDVHFGARFATEAAAAVVGSVPRWAAPWTQVGTPAVIRLHDAGEKKAPQAATPAS